MRGKINSGHWVLADLFCALFLGRYGFYGEWTWSVI
jgi:hypothetical protein